jgi:hypothetical protein
MLAHSRIMMQYSGSSAVAAALQAVAAPASVTLSESDAPVNGGESPDAEIIAAMATVLQQQQQHRSGAATAVVQLSPTATAATAASTTLEQLEHTAAVQERAEAALKASHTLISLQLLVVSLSFFLL